MTTKITVPEKKYPYLAVHTLRKELTLEEVQNLSSVDLILISLVEVHNSDKKVYVQPLLGGKQGYFTEREQDYFPMPKGYSIELIQ